MERIRGQQARRNELSQERVHLSPKGSLNQGNLSQRDTHRTRGTSKGNPVTLSSVSVSCGGSHDDHPAGQKNSASPILVSNRIWSMEEAGTECKQAGKGSLGNPLRPPPTRLIQTPCNDKKIRPKRDMVLRSAAAGLKLNAEAAEFTPQNAADLHALSGEIRRLFDKDLHEFLSLAEQLKSMKDVERKASLINLLLG